MRLLDYINFVGPFSSENYFVKYLRGNNSRNKIVFSKDVTFGFQKRVIPLRLPLGLCMTVVFNRLTLLCRVSVVLTEREDAPAKQGAM